MSNPEIESNPTRDRANQLLGLTRHIMEQIVAESPYGPDMEWELWHRAQQIEDENGFPDGITAFDVHQRYLAVFEGEG